MAYGDHQVANVATEVEARTIGASLRQPALDANRLPAGFDQPFFDLPTLGPLPARRQLDVRLGHRPEARRGPGDVLGTDPPPITNTAPNDSFGVDPHDTVIRSSPLIREQIANFIKPAARSPTPAAQRRATRRAGWAAVAV